MSGNKFERSDKYFEKLEVYNPLQDQFQVQEKNSIEV